MKKNKLLYILTILITLFTFNMNVRAEPEYDEQKYNDKTQYIGCDAFANLTRNMGNDSAALVKLDTTKYDLTCTYAMDVNQSYHIVNNYLGGEFDRSESGCHVIQFSVNKNGDVLVSRANPIFSEAEYAVKNAALGFKDVVKNNAGVCPKEIYVGVTTVNTSTSSTTTDCDRWIECRDTVVTSTTQTDQIRQYITISLDGKDPNGNTISSDVYPLGSGSGYNLLTNQSYKFDKWANTLIGSKVDILDCEHLFTGVEGEDLKEIIKWVIQIVKIAIPILLIGLGIMDFVKAVFSGKEDDMKKAQEKFIKRIIIGVCIFLIPTLITYILNLYNLVWDKNIDTDFCGILN